MPSPLPQNQLVRMAAIRLLTGFILLAALLLLPAGTWRYWQAWLYLATLFIPMTLVFGYLIKHDPQLLERRLRTHEKDAAQSLLIKLGSLCYLLIFVLPGLAQRWGHPSLPAAVSIAADGVFLLGYGLFVRVLRENSYASRVVEVEAGQRVISSGPYAIVRHPMYSAILLMFLATPLALGSCLALLPAALLAAVIVARIFNEERLLAEQLPGYRQYMHTTRYRLLPGVW